jgi:serine/threonine protein kinase
MGRAPLEGSEQEESAEEDVEDAKDYRRGGYHPLNYGDLFKQRYRVVKKLGWGHFSTVWMVHDASRQQYAALKIVKSAPHYTEAAEDEVKLLRAVRESDPASRYRDRVVQLIDDFAIFGPNGTHVAMVTEVLGCTLLKLIRTFRYRGLPRLLVKRVIRQVLEGLDYLHTKCTIIHTDIKPENILIVMPPEEVQMLGELARQGCSSLGPATPASGQRSLSKNQKKNKKRRMQKKGAPAGPPVRPPGPKEGARGHARGRMAWGCDSQHALPAPFAGLQTKPAPTWTRKQKMRSRRRRRFCPAPRRQRDHVCVSYPFHGQCRQRASSSLVAVLGSLKERLMTMEFLQGVDVKIADLGNACWVVGWPLPAIGVGASSQPGPSRWKRAAACLLWCRTIILRR